MTAAASEKSAWSTSSATSAKKITSRLLHRHSSPPFLFCCHVFPAPLRHVEPSSSLLEAIDLIIHGAQNLVVPIKNKSSKRKQLRQYPSIAPTTNAGGSEFCWLTQEDVIRFLLSSIGLFSPIAAYSIDSLGIITTEILTINYHSPASKAVEAISTSLIGY